MERIQLCISDRLQQALWVRKWSQTDLANCLHISPVNVSRWVNGQRLPSARIMPRIAKALEVSTDYLYGLTDDINPTYVHRFNPVADGWCQHPEVPPLLLQLNDDEAFQPYLAKPHLRALLSGIACHRDTPKRHHLLSLLDYANYILDRLYDTEPMGAPHSD